MKSRKNFLVSVLLFMALCLLAGFGSKPIELLDKGRLIDLDKAIQNADFGKVGSETSIKEKNQEEPQENLGDQNKIEEVETAEKKKETYKIIVRGETILFEDRKCKNTEELKKLITPLSSEKSGISLLDDYAEAHIYREVLEVIKEVGIYYTEEK
ncbi:MAG: hypothetical protein HDR06_14690 [Lachnospiraceae bacterium]|nr:hypothetical protein [Lachnospiraceae bacterium]